MDLEVKTAHSEGLNLREKLRGAYATVHRLPKLKKASSDEQRADALLRLIQRNKPSDIDETIAELMVICRPEEMSYRATQPTATEDELTRFCHDTREQLENFLAKGKRGRPVRRRGDKAGNVHFWGGRDARWSVDAPAGLNMVLAWDGSNQPARTYFASPNFIGICHWQTATLLGQFIHRITRCKRRQCRKFFIMRKRARYCSARCGQRIHNASYARNLPVEKRARLNQLHYVRNLAKRRRGAFEVDRYLARLGQKDPATAAWLREKIEEDQKRITDGTTNTRLKRRNNLPAR